MAVSQWERLMGVQAGSTEQPEEITNWITPAEAKVVLGKKGDTSLSLTSAANRLLTGMPGKVMLTVFATRIIIRAQDGVVADIRQ